MILYKENNVTTFHYSLQKVKSLNKIFTDSIFILNMVLKTFPTNTCKFQLLILQKFTYSKLHLLAQWNEK